MRRIFNFLSTIKIERTQAYLLAIVVVLIGMVAIVVLVPRLPSERDLSEQSINDPEFNFEGELPPEERYTVPIGETWAAAAPQEPEDITKLEVALPYRGGDFTILTVKDESNFVVEYPPYLEVGDIENQVVSVISDHGYSKFTISWKSSSQVNITEIDYDLSELTD